MEPAANPTLAALFATHALRLCPEGQPFWYTSGRLGPFYINTHFLFGGEPAAANLLDAIEQQATADRLALPRIIGARIAAHTAQDTAFAGVIARLAEAARGLNFDFVSGGERRDFFFSLPVARILGVPHLCIFKDLDAVYTPADGGPSVPAEAASLSGRRALHVADLVTEASSYTRAWLPALAALGVTMTATLAVVDRDQGGREILAKQGVPLTALVRVDAAMLRVAQAQGLLTEAQYGMVLAFLRDPDAFVCDFLRDHPDFLAQQIALGGKAEERARRCMALGLGGRRPQASPG
ncbi:MAG: orotate phosphoribosyltransferase [Oscillospiraceae bacterium]|jgi:orotate phosphoribosyltransferase|nr:orotate phosphoribosyltransferase [Oscillospiraceae bacterium]